MAIGSMSQPVYIDDLGVFKTCDVVSKLIAGSNVNIIPIAGSPGEYKISATGGGGGSGGTGGGVIDGTTWDTPTSTTKTFSAGVKQTIYTVANDCCLYIKMTNAPVAGSIQFFIGDNPILSANDVAGNGPQGTSALIPVAKGSIISALVTEGTAATHTFTFYEFKLNSLVPQLSFPDWNVTSKSGNLVETLKTSSYNVTKNGFLFCNLCVTAGKITVKVNNVEVATWYNLLSEGDADYCSHIVPVSVDDVVSMTRTDNTQPFAGEIVFYPAKVTVNEVDVRYKTNTVTNGLLLDRAANFVSMDGNTTLKLPNAMGGLVRDFIFTMTVVTAGTLTLQNYDGTTFTSYMFDENGDDPLSQTFEAGGVYQFYFTESVGVGTFRVECNKLTNPS